MIRQVFARVQHAGFRPRLQDARDHQPRRHTPLLEPAHGQGAAPDFSGEPDLLGARAAAALAFAPDGKTLAVGTNAIWLLDAASGKAVRTFGSHRGGIHAAATSDGKTAFTAGDEGTVVIWDVATCRERGRLEGQDQTITSIVVFDGGRRLLTSGIHMWDLTTNKELRWIRAPYAFG